MKLKTKVGSWEVEVEGDDLNEAFNKMAEASELLSHGFKCGKTGNLDVIMRVREAGEYSFPEFFCPESQTSLSLGQKKTGGFFPKRKHPKTGEWLPNGGWMTWQERKALEEGGKREEKEFDPNF